MTGGVANKKKQDDDLWWGGRKKAVLVLKGSGDQLVDGLGSCGERT